MGTPTLGQTLQDMRTRAAEATAGPWHTGKSYGAVVAPVTAPNAPHADPGNTAAYGGALIGESISRMEDRQFIAHARTDLPRLLAAIEAVQHLALEYASESDSPAETYLARCILKSLAVTLGADEPRADQ